MKLFTADITEVITLRRTVPITPTARFSHLASRPEERAGRRLLAGVILRRKVWRRQVVNLTSAQAAQHDADTAWFKRLYRWLLRASRADAGARKGQDRR